MSDQPCARCDEVDRVAKAWNTRSDPTSSPVASTGTLGNPEGESILDTSTALIMVFMVARKGWGFGRDMLPDLMERAVDGRTTRAIRQAVVDTTGVKATLDVHPRTIATPSSSMRTSKSLPPCRSSQLTTLPWRSGSA